MGASLYRTVAALGRVFVRYDVLGLEQVEADRAGLFVANHARNAGPVVVVTSIPLRFFPWVKADLIDPARSPAHLYKEFVQPSLHLAGWPGWVVARAITHITVPLLAGIGCIPVENERFWTGGALRRSGALLAQGAHVLMFPENPRAPLDPATGIHPFERGFVLLCRQFARANGHDLPLYPLAVHAPSRRIAVGPPAYYHEDPDRRKASDQFSARVRDAVRALYLELDA